MSDLRPPVAGFRLLRRGAGSVGRGGRAMELSLHPRPRCTGRPSGAGRLLHPGRAPSGAVVARTRRADRPVAQRARRSGLRRGGRPPPGAVAEVPPQAANHSTVATAAEARVDPRPISHLSSKVQRRVAPNGGLTSARFEPAAAQGFRHALGAARQSPAPAAAGERRKQRCGSVQEPEAAIAQGACHTAAVAAECSGRP